MKYIINCKRCRVILNRISDKKKNLADCLCVNCIKKEEEEKVFIENLNRVKKRLLSY